MITYVAPSMLELFTMIENGHRTIVIVKTFMSYNERKTYMMQPRATRPIYDDEEKMVKERILNLLGNPDNIIFKTVNV